MTPNKYYAIDNGLRRVNSPQSTADLGHRLENAVFLALRRNKTPVSYAGEANLWECDFVTDTAAIQVCATLNAQNQEREVRGAVRAAALPGKRRAIIITLDQRDRLTLDNVTVEVVPAWEWLAETAITRALRPETCGAG